MESLNDQLLAYKSGIVFLWIALLFTVERFIPADEGNLPTEYRPQAYLGRFARFFPVRVFRNLGLWGCNVILSPIIVLQLTAWASEHALQWRPDFMDNWHVLVIDILILDLLIYWWHRLNHEIPFLWRFHEIHHLDDSLDTTSALRFHFGEVLLSASARAGVIILLDISFVSIIVFETLVLLATVFHHSNIRLLKTVEKALGALIITPEIHWIHHRARQKDTDSNYGTIFSWWDPLFRTRSPNTRTSGMRIGVEGERDKTFVTLLMRPFKR